MQRKHKFSANVKMSDLIISDHSLLLVISRFGIPLGFGDKTISEVCHSAGIHCNTFLAVVNFISEDNFDIENDTDDISIETVIDYLKSAHNYFLNFKLPSIRVKLLEAVNQPNQNLPYGLIFTKFFDEYVLEVQKHMQYENDIVFKYALKLVEGKRDAKYSISVFQHRHNEIDSKLEELKNIIIKYYPDNGSNHLLTDVLFDILSCEIDIASHNKVEDYLFAPAIEAIEKKLATR
jgi:regulator of cell morphogenesis and NO signaling